MRVPKLGVAALALVSGISLGGCAYDSYGGYGGYGGGYSGVSFGVGYGGGYGYGDPYYGGGYGYYGSPFGWYDDFYYPGTGIYVYDSYRRPHAWNDRQRRYWSQRSGSWQHHDRSSSTVRTNVQPNWSGFNRHSRGDRRH
jgi:hypothetical protein